nr:transposase [Salinimonas lutimaris]
MTGKCYEHRRQWVEDRILLLAEIFCVDVCAYAVMNNHTHLVLRINKVKADALSVDEIIHRWRKLYKGVLLIQRYSDPCQREVLSEAEIATVKSIAEVYRHRLYDISWFMRLLNEYIARLANKEDDCTGHFWEGRFKSQALLDETALAACMAYVDLNPVRAQLADTIEKSSHTSICKRIRAARVKRQPTQLLPFADKLKNTRSDGLPFQLEDYFALVESTCRHFRPKKRDKIDDTVSPILTRVGLEHTDWHAIVSGIETEFRTNVSHEDFIRNRNKQRTYNSV